MQTELFSSDRASTGGYSHTHSVSEIHEKDESKSFACMSLGEDFCFPDRYDSETKIHVIKLILACLRAVKSNEAIYKPYCSLIDFQYELWTKRFNSVKSQFYQYSQTTINSSQSVTINQQVSQTTVTKSKDAEISKKLALALASCGILCVPKGDSNSRTTKSVFTRVMNHVLYIDSEAYLLLHETLGCMTDHVLLEYMLTVIISISTLQVRYDPLLKTSHICASECEDYISAGALCCAPCSKPVCKRVSEDKEIISVRIGTEVNINKGLFLWRNGSVITWKIDQSSFCNPIYGRIVEEAMTFALAAWNRVMNGYVTFKCVSHCQNSTFTVVWNDAEAGRLAFCPTPEEYNAGLTEIRIFEGLLSVDYRAQMANIIAHEVGHMLGFKHGFCLTKKIESGYSCYMPCTERVRSIMAHEVPHYISASDVKNARFAYETYSEGQKIPIPSISGELVEYLVHRVPVPDCEPIAKYC